MLRDLDYFKKKNKVKINLMNDQRLGLQDYSIELKSKLGKVLEKVEKIENLHKITEEKTEQNLDTKKSKKTSFKRKKFKKKKIIKKN